MNDIDEFFEIAGSETENDFKYMGTVKNLSTLTNMVGRGFVRPNEMYYLESIKYILIAKKAPDGKVGIDFDVFERRAIGRNVVAVRRSGDGSWR